MGFLEDLVGGQFGGGGPLGGVGIKTKTGGGFGAIMDWGKATADPSKAKLDDGAFMRDYIKGQLGGVGGRQAPSAGGASTMGAAQIDPRAQAEFRQRQMTLADQLAGIAGGTQRGAGEMAVGRQFQQGLAGQMAGARMARGANAALGARSAARGIGDMTVNAAGMSSQAAAGDQQQAQGLLAGLLGQGRGADLDLAGQQAGLNQQAAGANMGAANQFKLADQAAKLQQMGMNDAAIANYLSQLYGISAAEMQARLAQEAGNMAQTGYVGDALQAGGSLLTGLAAF